MKFLVCLLSLLLAIPGCFSGSNSSSPNEIITNNLSVEVKGVENNQNNVNRAFTFNLEFSADILPSSINNQTVILQSVQDNKNIDLNFININSKKIMVNLATEQILSANTTYTLLIKNTIESLKNNQHLKNDLIIQFTTGQNATLLASLVTPADLKNVNINTSFVIKFNMKTAPLSRQDIEIWQNSTEETQTIKYISSTDNVFWNVTLSKPLKENTKYSISLSDNITDKDQNSHLEETGWSFQTSADNFPILINSSPANGATNVGIKPELELEFSSNMDEKTINVSTVKLYDQKHNSVNIKEIVAESAAKKTFKIKLGLLTPAFAYGSQYTITLSQDITDFAGRHLQSVTSISFTTEPNIPTVASNITGLVSLKAEMILIFSNSMNNVINKTVYLHNVTDPQHNLPITVTAVPLTNNKSFQISLVEPNLLNTNSKYSITFDDSITASSSGNHLAAGSSIDFSTGSVLSLNNKPKAVPTIISVIFNEKISNSDWLDNEKLQQNMSRYISLYDTMSSVPVLLHHIDKVLFDVETKKLTLYLNSQPLDLKQQYLLKFASSISVNNSPVSALNLKIIPVAGATLPIKYSNSSGDGIYLTLGDVKITNSDFSSNPKKYVQLFDGQNDITSYDMAEVTFDSANNILNMSPKANWNILYNKTYTVKFNSEITIKQGQDDMYIAPINYIIDTSKWNPAPLKVDSRKCTQLPETNQNNLSLECEFNFINSQIKCNSSFFARNAIIQDLTTGKTYNNYFDQGFYGYSKTNNSCSIKIDIYKNYDEQIFIKNHNYNLYLENIGTTDNNTHSVIGDNFEFKVS
jgi:hypothetical protein